jgi:hypothetical protein
MVYISETIINRVKEAGSAQEVRRIIENAIPGLKIRPESGQIDKKYTRNILMALKHHKKQELEPRALDNINVAVDVFRKLHEQGTENFF